MILFSEPAETRPAIKPRQYQLDAFEAVKTYLEYREGNPCVVLPTGAGKTILIVLLCQWVASWGGRVLILAHVRELLQQAADKLNAMSPELDVGVYSAGLGRREKTGAVTVAGIQSVYQRAAEFDPFDLVIVDECHLIPADGEGMYRTFLNEAKTLNSNIRLVGLTATPYRMTTGPLCGAAEILTAVCCDVPVVSLIEQGFLSKLISKRVIECDTSKLHVRGGEFVAEEVSLLMGSVDAVRLACEEIIVRTQRCESVLIFCSCVEHAEAVRHRLMGSVLITGETEHREEILDRFKRREIRYLVNVNVLTTGFDAPNVDCVVLLRPTLSPGLYYQMVGRGFRLHPRKENCLILDFGGNVQRHGPINRIRVEKKSKGKPTGEAATRVCPDCDEVLFVSSRECPACGYVWPLIDEAKHDHQPGNEEIIGDDEADELPVYEVRYRKHYKKGGFPDDPCTLRVEYVTRQGSVSSWVRNAVVSEWVCLEHHGFAKKKAAAWWTLRSNNPMPDTVDRAIDMAEGGGLAVPSKIWVTAEGKYTRIVRVELGPKPEAAALCESCGGAGCDECKFEFSDVTPVSVFDVEDVPF
jgi:DNA repair protein RadD